MSELFGIIALAFFPLTVIGAGIADLTTMRIPNRLVGTMLLGYILLAPLAGFLLSQMALGFAAASIVFCPCHRRPLVSAGHRACTPAKRACLTAWPWPQRSLIAFTSSPCLALQ